MEIGGSTTQIIKDYKYGNDSHSKSERDDGLILGDRWLLYCVKIFIKNKKRREEDRENRGFIIFILIPFGISQGLYIPVYRLHIKDITQAETKLY